MSKPCRAPRPTTRRVWLAAAAALPLLGARAAFAQTAAGEVAAVRGTASAERGQGTRPLGEHDAVFLDELLRTGEDSRLGVALTNGTRLNLGARSKLKIDRMVVDGGGHLDLGSGALLLDRADPSRKGGLTVTSPFAVIAVRGTKFFIGEIDGFGVFVERGVVEVDAAGKRVTLTAGEGTTIANIGDPPDAPRVWGAPKIARAMAMAS